MKEKKFTIKIIMDKKVVYQWTGKAFDENQAKEFAYDQFEMDSYAETVK